MRASSAVSGRHPLGWHCVLALSTTIGLLALVFVGPYLLWCGTLVESPLRRILATARYHADCAAYGDLVGALLHPDVAANLRARRDEGKE